jgi:hypothetical protein
MGKPQGTAAGADACDALLYDSAKADYRAGRKGGLTPEEVDDLIEAS